MSLWHAGSYYLQKKPKKQHFHSTPWSVYPYLTATAAEWSCQYFAHRSLGSINASAPARDRLQQADLRTDPLCSLHRDEPTPLGVSFNWPRPSWSNCIYLYNTDSCTHTHTQTDSQWCTHARWSQIILGHICWRISQHPSPSPLISETEELSG